MNRIARLLVLILIVATAAEARVISYAPYTDRPAIPATQNRLNRHFVLFEQAPGPQVPISVGSPPTFIFFSGQVVLYDSKGLEEPRVIYPLDGSFVAVSAIAAREEGNVVSVLVETIDSNNAPKWIMTNDSGATWGPVGMPRDLVFPAPGIDNGGAFVRSKYSQVRIGTRDVPFVVSAGFGIYGISSSRVVINLFSASSAPVLIGSDREGQRVVAKTSSAIFIIDVQAQSSMVAQGSLPGNTEGWITPDGGVFVEDWEAVGQVIFWYAKDGAMNPVAASWDGPPNAIPPINPSWIFFAVPTADYSGAWIMKEGARPDTLYLYTPSSGAVMQWQDITQPQIEALIPGQSGDKVLIQVHRPRPTLDQLTFKDPAIAVWHAGDPAPKAYDELFLSETSAKAFVHVDVDAIEKGDPFVFDSGAGIGPAPIVCIVCSPPPPSGGGSDVIQEWGVVRASLQQKLVLPGVGHTDGAFGSKWATDVTLYNPGDAPIQMSLAYRTNVPYPPLVDPGPPASWGLTLAPHEVRVIPDIVHTFFGWPDSTGTAVITPEGTGGVNVTSRTYNTTANGTFGFTMNGIDMFSAAGPRFPITFSGAFEGANYRTNVIVVDASGRGTSANATVAGPEGSRATEAISFDASPSGQSQFNSIEPMLGVGGNDTGALVLQPTRGEAIASVFVIDNRTNDPTFFPPDIPASVIRVIPAIGHLDGANGAKFRSDLFLFNNSAEAKTVTLTAQPWNQSTANAFGIPLTLLPHEARVIPDVLLTLFNKVGLARLRFSIVGPTTDTSVRVTSRTYTIGPDGGTYGFLMPPLNSFQSASPGDTLEILGASLDPHFRTNLGLVELSASIGPTPAQVRVDIIDDHGASLDSFEVNVPSAGGMQIDNLFHERNLAESTRPVLIRVTTITGMIGAYAAIVDNATNDPAYVAANLAAKN